MARLPPCCSASKRRTPRIRTRWRPGALAGLLPPGLYAFANEPHGGAAGRELAALGWALAAYRFARYKSGADAWPRLVAPQGVDPQRVARLADAQALARDLINTPANDMGPDALEAAAADVAKRHRAKFSAVRGEALLARNFPLIHAVGKAAQQAPRLVDMTWARRARQKSRSLAKGSVSTPAGSTSSRRAPC